MDNIFENENYTVTADGGELVIEGNSFPTSYALKNKDTGVIEFRTPCLPEALGIAVKWNMALTNEHHMWPTKIGEAAEEFDITDMLQ